jgi:hypothetical protein
MTEAEWLASDEPEEMLLHLSDTDGLSDRKARLFGCSCVRRVWDELHDERLREATEVAERFADGLVSARQLAAARNEAERLCKGIGDIIADHGAMAVQSLCERRASLFTSADSTSGIAAEARFDEKTSWGAAQDEEKRAQARLLRDIAGNPLRPVAFDRAWLSWNDGALVNLAQAIYDGRAFDRVPILADALEDAGCDNADILSHLRGPGPHVRGCWVVDLLLGKQ